MNSGIMPVTGIPLPFISYGGSAMWANMISIGLLLNINLEVSGYYLNRNELGGSLRSFNPSKIISSMLQPT